MSNESSEERDIRVGDLVDYLFPSNHLMTWAQTACHMKIRGDSTVFPNLRKITGHPEFKRGFGGVDVLVTRPSSKESAEIIHGSFFYPQNFRLLEDPELNRVLNKARKAARNIFSRDDFIDATLNAGILIGAATLPHGLKYGEIEKIIRHHCLPYVLYDRVNQSWRDYREGALLLYGCTKVLANRLDYPSASQPSR